MNPSVIWSSEKHYDVDMADYNLYNFEGKDKFNLCTNIIGCVIIHAQDMYVISETS